MGKLGVLKELGEFAAEQYIGPRNKNECELCHRPISDDEESFYVNAPSGASAHLCRDCCYVHLVELFASLKLVPPTISPSSILEAGNNVRQYQDDERQE